MIRAASLLLAAGLAFPATAQTPPPRDWQMTLGAAALYAPDYEGSDDHKVRALPYVDASYKDTVFFRGTTLGANLVSVNGPRPGDGLRIGPLIRYGFGRDEGDNEALRGLGDIDAAIELGVFARYSAGSWLADLQVAKDVAGGHEGVLVDAGIGWRQALSPRWRTTVRAHATWADETHMQNVFGISAAQSARSGLRRHEAGGGFKDVGLSASLSYALTENWLLIGRAGYSRLLGDAADSPIVADKGSADQLSGMLTIGYRF